MGATIRAVGHRWRPVLAVPYAAMGRHQVVIGAPGSGKTNLMIRTWAGWCRYGRWVGAVAPLAAAYSAAISSSAAVKGSSLPAAT